jgi:surface protein
MVPPSSLQPVLAALPSELVQLIVECLQKGEQYLCLSLTKQWLPLLHKSRTICISPDIRSDFYSCPDMWSMFRDFNVDIMRVIDPDDALREVRKQSRRKLTLSLSRAKVEESVTLVLKHVLYFDCINLSAFNPRSTAQLLPVVQLHNPTAASLTRVLLSQTSTNKYLDGNLDHLHSFVEAEANHILQDADNERHAEVSATSLLTLRGVRGLQMHSDGSVFLELGPDSDCKLQTVVLDRCHRVTDISALHGVPKVILSGCEHIADIQALSEARSVEIWGCLLISKVSALKDIEEVTLEKITLGSIRELDKVNKLTVRNCSIDEYPVPSIGKGQAWDFEGATIADLSGWGCLEKLTLSNCSRVNDISMLGAVRYLTIYSKNSLILPKPSGRLQEWTLVGISFLSPEQLQLLSGLCCLMLDRCSFSKCNRTLSGLTNIEYLDCRELDNIDSIDNLTNIRTLHVRRIFTSLLSVTSLHNVPYIHIRGTIKLRFSETCHLKSLSISARREADLSCLRGCMQTLHTLHLRETTIDMNFESRSEWRNLEVLTIVRCQNKHQHIRPTNNIVPTNAERDNYKLDNFTLRTAVDLWCVWEERARAIYGDISNWDVSRVTDMRGLFADQQYFNSDIGNWDVSNVTNMSAMLHYACKFNQPLESWHVNNVRYMISMFYNATSFNQPLADWDVRSVRNMNRCFGLASSFNQPLDSWVVSKVEDKSSMFAEATSFNQPLDSWDVSNVQIMSCMFHKAKSFNGSIAAWNIGKVTHMSSMFAEATAFNQPLDSWDVSNVKYMPHMFRQAASFNGSIVAWNVGKVTHVGSMFEEATSFNQPLASWDVSNVQIMSHMFRQAKSFNGSIVAWNVGKVTHVGSMFEEATSFNQPLASWDVSNVQIMSHMFRQAASFNGSIVAWNVGKVTHIISMFEEATSFNQPLDSWDVSNVRYMSSMFHKAASFNGSIAAWNVGKVTHMISMFAEATSFNQPLDSWNVSNVQSTSHMFRQAASFNGSIAAWDVSNVTDMSSMLEEATSFNQPLASWDVSNVRTMARMFSGASSFNQTLLPWNM